MSNHSGRRVATRLPRLAARLRDVDQAIEVPCHAAIDLHDTPYKWHSEK